MPESQKEIQIRDFAEQLNWTPNYTVHDRRMPDRPMVHLVVEHGLENTTTLTFLSQAFDADNIDSLHRSTIFEASYNNLISRHIFLFQNKALFYDNLKKKPLIKTYDLSSDEISVIESGQSHQVFSKVRGPELVRCDDALIRTVRRWKQILEAEFQASEASQGIASLFNALFFLRAWEDFNFLQKGVHDVTLKEQVIDNFTDDLNLGNLISAYIDGVSNNDDLRQMMDFDKLALLPPIPKWTAVNLISDFYKGDLAPYRFNFAFMSKHALSRIYERYVADFREPEEPAGDGLAPSTGPLIDEVQNVERGEIYTPEFIATFFSKFVLQEIPPRRLVNLRVLDPACGSGIFLRSFCEHAANFAAAPSRRDIDTIISNVHGVDKDFNAVQASRLSIALFQLVTQGTFQRNENIQCGEALRVLHEEWRDEKFDMIVANPPFSRYETLSQAEQALCREILQEVSSGKFSIYYAFLYKAMLHVAAGGYVCIVVPEAFRHAASAKGIRKEILRNFEMRAIVDLSLVEVFADVGAYVLLLILQRPYEVSPTRQFVQVAKVKSFAGLALESLLAEVETENSFFSVYSLPKKAFEGNKWALPSQKDYMVERELRDFPKITQYCAVKLGYISSCDKVFVVDADFVPDGERDVYRALVRDREISRYGLPRKATRYAFYPFRDGHIMDWETLALEFPNTARYLETHRDILESRRAVEKGEINWWQPERPRKPKEILRPKIVTPHLCLRPKFAVDIEGDRLPSHTPFLIMQEQASREVLEDGMLKVLCACLNSSVGSWYLSMHGFTYGKGYMRWEKANLAGFPVPDFERVDPRVIDEVIRYVDSFCKRGEEFESARHLDRLVLDMYGIRGDIMGWSEEDDV